MNDHSEFMRRSAILLTWFLLIVYTVPTIFMVMIVAVNIKPYEHALLFMWAWGGVITAFAIQLRRSAEKWKVQP